MTVSPEAKFVPVTVNVMSPPPATTELGESDVTVGAPAGGVGPEPPPVFSVPLNPDPHPEINQSAKTDKASRRDQRISTPISTIEKSG